MKSSKPTANHYEEQPEGPRSVCDGGGVATKACSLLLDNCSWAVESTFQARYWEIHPTWSEGQQAFVDKGDAMLDGPCDQTDCITSAVGRILVVCSTAYTDWTANSDQKSITNRNCLRNNVKIHPTADAKKNNPWSICYDFELCFRYGMHAERSMAKRVRAHNF